MLQPVMNTRAQYAENQAQFLLPGDRNCSTEWDDSGSSRYTAKMVLVLLWSSGWHLNP